MIKEFKEFINKGSVMDLAVGMIIGSAFTAIVSALVNNILTPLISWIPGSKHTNSLQTVLKPAIIDANGNVLREALILDWGAVFGAIITFLLTALVLFFIIKTFNKLKQAGEKVKVSVEDLEKKIRTKINGEYIEQEAENQPQEELESLPKENENLESSPQEIEEIEELETTIPASPMIAEQEETVQNLLREIIRILSKDIPNR